MPSWLPAIPYPSPDQNGFWEPVTSTIQWCEEDYMITYYSAEIVNTFTNLMYFYCAWKGVRSCQKQGHDRIFEIAYFGYLLVGFGSFMFHSTLKYPWQLVDELNMIYTTCLMIYANLSYARPLRFRVWLAAGCIFFCGAITIYYHYLQDPLFHQNVYAAMTIWLVLRSAYQMEISLRPRWRKSIEAGYIRKQQQDALTTFTAEERDRLDKTDLEILQNMWILVAWGVSVFLTGFALWGVDNVFCSRLRTWRREIGLPYGLFLEFHGWWHILTGYGAYCYIVWGIHLRHILNGDHREYTMIWPKLYNLPELVRKPQIEIESNGSVINGHAEKANGHSKLR